MKSDLIKKLVNEFEAVLREVENVECWFARELQTLLGYTEWRNFLQVIDKAKIACRNARQEISDHFVGVSKMLDIGKRCVAPVVLRFLYSTYRSK